MAKLIPREIGLRAKGHLLGLEKGEEALPGMLQGQGQAEITKLTLPPLYQAHDFLGPSLVIPSLWV